MKARRSGGRFTHSDIAYETLPPLPLKGFRFFDLKRMGSIDNVMTIVSPQKNSNWAPYMQYWPIPTSETLANLNLKQTPGYQQ